MSIIQPITYFKYLMITIVRKPIDKHNTFKMPQIFQINFVFKNE